MIISKRSFLKGSAAAAMLPLLPSPLVAQMRPNSRPVDVDRIYIPKTGRAAKPLNILIMGGSVFVGPALVKAALARGHKVTLFNRGVTNPGIFPNVERIKGDRTLFGGEGLAALKGRRFDRIIDTWADAPRAVEDSARLLAGQTDQYLYISSIAVYSHAAWSSGGVTEDRGRRVPRAGTDPASATINYNVRKSMAEDYAMAGLGEKLTVIRPHQILGYHIAKESATQRYWPMRFAEGGEILVPGDGEDQTQFMEVGDLAAFAIKLVEDGRRGAFNAMNTLKWRDFAESLSALSPTPPKLRWVDAATLGRHRLEPFMDLPVWTPRDMMPGFMDHNASKAIAAGLTFRPNIDLWRDIVAGTAPLYPEGYSVPTTGEERPMTREREREVLAALA